MKKLILSSIIIQLLLLSALIGFNRFTGGQPSFINPAATQVTDCDFYFDSQNGYTSLYDINQDLYFGSSVPSYKTWGTVTKTFIDSSSNFNFYIQSSDASHRISGILIYQSSRTDIIEGNVVTVSGTPVLYNNLPEFINPSITIDYATNSSPVITLETTSAFWNNGTNRYSDEFITAQAMGARKLKIVNQTINYLSVGNAEVMIDGLIAVPLYFGYLQNTVSIGNKINMLSGTAVTVTGYLHCYINSSGTVKMQLLIRDEDDITGDISSDYEFVLNEFSGYNIGSYATGNYGSSNVQSISFEHYRAVRTDYQLMTLLPYVNGSGDGTIAGAFYNTSPFLGIRNISINYATNRTTGTKPMVTFGATPISGTTIELDFSLATIETSIDASNSNYFKVETTQCALTIENIVISYTNDGTLTPYDYLTANTELKRINPITYDGTLVNGVSVEVPIAILDNGTTYSVLTTKQYTYYTFDYIANNPGLVDLARQTHPRDVAAYYVAFNTWPANYVPRSNYYEAYMLFGEDARCVSSYTRTDGYVTSVPYATDWMGIPLYHELDIALTTNYSSSNRGVGRVVCYEYGFDTSKGATSYDEAPVCVYTDDHYASFSEYLNVGIYGTRFNGEMTRTSYVWGSATTLTTV